MERRSLIVIALEVVLGALAITVGPFGALGMAAVALGIFKNISVYDFFSDGTTLTVEDVSDHELRLKVYSATGQVVHYYSHCVKLCCFRIKVLQLPFVHLR
jgi:hypothetical protein